MADDTELEDLQALVQSPGFARFKAWAAEEFGNAAYRRKASSILKRCSDENKMDQAPSHLLQLETAAMAVQGLFDRVADRIKSLRGRQP